MTVPIRFPGSTLPITPFPKLEGVKFYLCGGAVRDIILNKVPKDLDFVMITDLSYEEVVDAIRAEGGETYMLKPEFLTIRCKLHGEVYDLVFPRWDGEYTDQRHPDKVERVKTLLEDAKRRDFTINAMYMDENKEVIDPMYGIGDIMATPAGRPNIRACGIADERIKEDPLRILRAIRFATQFSGTIDMSLYESMVENLHMLDTVSEDRIRDEINKALQIDAEVTMAFIRDFKLYPIFEHKRLRFQLTSKRGNL